MCLWVAACQGVVPYQMTWSNTRDSRLEFFIICLIRLTCDHLVVFMNRIMFQSHLLGGGGVEAKQRVPNYYRWSLISKMDDKRVAFHTSFGTDLKSQQAKTH